MLLKAATAAESTTKSFRGVNSLSQYTTFVNEATQAQTKMANSANDLAQAQQKQVQAQKEVVTITAKSNTEWRNVIGTLDQNIIQAENYKKRLSELRDEKKRATGTSVAFAREEAELKQALSQTNIIIRQQVKEVQAADGTGKKFAVTLGLMRESYRELTNQEKNSPFGRQLLTDINELDTQMKAADASIGNFQRNVGDYKQGFNNAFESFTTGDIQGGIDQAKTALNGLLTSVRAFITSPIGIAVTALAGIGLLAKELWDYNAGIKETIRLTEQLTGVSGKQADAIRQQGQALTETFGGEFEENVKAADKLVKNFGISYNQAFNEVERGLIRGGAANKEFFDSLREYPVFFANAGYSAREFIDLINEGFTQGVYNDKLIDAIKEADISLREQTKSTRDALINAFGASFTDDILKRVRTGATSVKDALNEIAIQAQQTALTEQQLAQLTAGIYREKGEDVGGAAKMFDIMRKAVENTNAPLTKSQKHLEDLAQANEDLQKAMDSALKTDGVINLQSSLELLWVKAKTSFFETLKPLREFYERVWEATNASEGLSTIWNGLKNLGSALFQSFNSLSKSFDRLGESLGLSTQEANNFINPMTIIGKLINGVAIYIEHWANVIDKTTIGIQALIRTIDQIDLSNFYKISNILGFTDAINDNIKAIEAEEKAQVENNKVKAEAKKAYDILIKAVQDVNAVVQAGAKSQTDIDKEAAARAEELAKKRDELAKKYAAAEKKRSDEAKKRLQEYMSEELSVMQATLKNYELNTNSFAEMQEGLTQTIIREANKRADEILKKQIELAEQEASIALSANSEKQRRITLSEVKAAKERGEELNSIELNLLNKGIEAEQKATDEKIKIREGANAYTQKLLEADIAYQTSLLKILTDNAIANGKEREQAEKDSRDAILDYTIEQYEKTYELDEDLLNTKLELGEELEKWEIDYLTRKAERRRNDIEDEIKGEEERAERLKELKEEAKKQKEEEFEYDKENRETYLEFLGASLGAEAEMRQISTAWAELLKAQELEDFEGQERAKLQIAAGVAGAMAAILGEQTALGKAAAVAQATINTYVAATAALSTQPAWLGIALAAVTIGVGIANVAKILSTKTPQAPKFSANPQFEHGVLGSTYEGVAIKDEAGAEIHLDKSGNVKDWGSNSGAKKFKIKKGDSIIPNPISEKIKDVMSYNPMPDLMMSLNLNGLIKNNNYDFNRLEKGLDDVKKAVTQKENVSFLDMGDFLIEVTKKNGNTHQRFIPKANTISRNQTGIQ